MRACHLHQAGSHAARVQQERAATFAAVEAAARRLGADASGAFEVVTHLYADILEARRRVVAEPA